MNSFTMIGILGLLMLTACSSEQQLCDECPAKYIKTETHLFSANDVYCEVTIPTNETDKIFIREGKRIHCIR